MDSQGLGLALRQQLKLSTQLLQTIDTIALSSEELREKIKREAEKNPTLIVRERNDSLDTFSNTYRSFTDRRESYSDTTLYTDSNDERPNWIEGTVSRKETLSEHLLGQLGCLEVDDNTKRVAETIITSLDRNGFTGDNPDKLIPKKDLPYLDKALSVVQSLEPIGIGAKDWKDSLMLQIKDKGASNQELNLFKKLIYKELDNIKSGKLEVVARDLRTDKEDVESMIALIKTLTPFPGLEYGDDPDEYIVPELSIRKIDGKLTLSLNKDALPIVEIDPAYEEMQKDLRKDKKDNKDTLKYLKDNLSSAAFLINQINARTSTLERTGKVLLEKQRDFFLNGPLYLKGLTMGEVAEEVGVHEATISRVAASKYIDTDFGIFPIRYLFSSKTRSEEGEDISKNAIKEMIRKMIEENTSSKALSDQRISDMLSEKGINIARRTVSKYRKELNIDSSFERTR